MKKFVYSVESDAKILDLCIGIINYLMLSYNPETQKVESQLLQYLEDLTFIIYLYTQEDEIFTQFFNHLTYISKRKQKYANIFQQIQRIVGLMIMTNKMKQIPGFLISQYSSNSDHMNNIKFSLLLNTFNTLPNQFQLKQYKEKILKEKNVTTDIILDLAKQTQNEETIEEVLSILKNYKNDFHGADSFLIKKKYFQLAYENGDQLDREEILDLLNADLFDLEHVQQIISYVEFFVDDSKSFVKEIVLKILEFSYGNNYLWGKLVRLFNSADEEKSVEYGQEEEDDDEYLQQISEQEGSQDQMELEIQENQSQNGSEKEEKKSIKKSKKKKEKNRLQFSENELEMLIKVQFSGKYKKKDLNILKKIASQNFSPKISSENLLHQFLNHKYQILEFLLQTQEENPILKDYKREFDDLQIQNNSMVLK
ncbi:hypothetical protein ABPG74_012887 [Tetrahymena malaccensis]